jgi:effector-binding domain-containing protein
MSRFHFPGHLNPFARVRSEPEQESTASSDWDDAVEISEGPSYKSSVRKIFAKLQADDIQHPEDRATIAALQKIPGIEAISSKINELAFERIGRLESIAGAIHVTERQYSQLYEILQEAALTLSMPVPELYLKRSPEVNAYSRGLETQSSFFIQD